MMITNADLSCFTKRLIERAERKLAMMEAGNVRAIPLKHAKQGILYKLEVGDHRLVSSDRVHWLLITHEKYNYLFQFKH